MDAQTGISACSFKSRGSGSRAEVVSCGSSIVVPFSWLNFVVEPSETRKARPTEHTTPTRHAKRKINGGGLLCGRVVPSEPEIGRLCVCVCV